MQKGPWHSKEPETEVYHDNTECTEGDNIESYNLERGKDGLRKCAHCARLDKK